MGDEQPSVTMSAMTTVLVVDDEPIVRDVVVRYLQRDGFETLEAGDGDAARKLIETGDAEPRRARRDAARHRRARALPLDPRARRPAGDHADRPRRGGRPDRRPRARRRRLRDEAVLAARARGARAHRAAPHAAAARRRRAARVRGRRRSTRARARRAGRASRSPDREGVRPALLPRVASAAACSRATS